jgi:hypothetical protein
MEAKSPSAAIKLVDGQINLIQRQLNLRLLSRKERDNLALLHQNLAEARIYAVDFELSETDEDRIKNVKTAKKWLANAQKRIVTASLTDIFEPVDVAHLSAQIEQVIADLKE